MNLIGIWSDLHSLRCLDDTLVLKCLKCFNLAAWLTLKIEEERKIGQVQTCESSGLLHPIKLRPLWSGGS